MKKADLPLLAFRIQNPTQISWQPFIAQRLFVVCIQKKQYKPLIQATLEPFL